MNISFALFKMTTAHGVSDLQTLSEPSKSVSLPLPGLILTMSLVDQRRSLMKVCDPI